MATITFDTHEFIKRLKSVGFSEEQAEVFAAEHRRIIENNLVRKSIWICAFANLNID